uniref:Uncharacterized protein n=1 Tax=Anopheles christyi TaxID=43041 RepID=A0A182KI16_9DIPT
MMADRMRAILPTIRALKAIRARAPRASGSRAAAFNLRRRSRGRSSFLTFFFLPRASSSERCMSSIDSFGTWNWRVWVPRKRAARSTSSPSISDSRASGSAGREMSFRERPFGASFSVWTNLIPSVISKSPSAVSARRSARSLAHSTIDFSPQSRTNFRAVVSNPSASEDGAATATARTANNT